MEETKEQKPRKDHTMWFIILIGILVIFLGATIVYAYKMNREVKELKNQSQTESNQENQVAIRDESNIEEVSKKNTTEDTTTKAQTNDKTYTYDNLKGTYKTTKKFENGEDSDAAYYDLYLYADGTFVYDYVTELVGAPSGVMGNYIINGKEIILNKLFSHGSDVGVTKDKGQIKLTINDDGSLTDKNNLLGFDELKNVKLLKKSSSISKDVQSLSSFVNGYISYLEEEINKK